MASLIALMVRLTIESIHRLATTPIAFTAQAAHRYVAPGMPWVAFLTLIGWCVMEAAVFT